MYLSKNHVYINEKDNIRKKMVLLCLMCMYKNYLFISEKDNIKIRGFTLFHLSV